MSNDVLTLVATPAQSVPHPLQFVLEEIIDRVLTDMEKEIFYLRFGEQLAFRAIARRMGYSSHQTFQLKVRSIINKVREALGEYSKNLQ